MNTAFDVELTETLRDLADEVGPGPENLAATALRDGRQIRRRRSAVAAMAVVIALATAAVPAVVRHAQATASAASHQHTFDIQVLVPAGSGTQATIQLRKRFTDAGFTVVSTSLKSATEILFRLGSTQPLDPPLPLDPTPPSDQTLPSNQTQDEIQQLASPGIMEFRTVLDSVQAPPVTDAEGSFAERQAPRPTTLATVKAKLGAAYTLAASLTGPVALDATTMAQFAPFADLTWFEVAVLPARIRFNVPTINCAQLVDAAPSPPIVAPAADQIVTCDDPYSVPRSKYLLSAAQLTNADIASARPVDDPARGWALTVTFTATGQRRWTDLQAHRVDKQVAIILDGTMLTFPQIPSPTRTSVTVTATDPDFTEASVTTLATVINDGPLPVRQTLVAFVIYPPQRH